MFRQALFTLLLLSSLACLVSCNAPLNSPTPTASLPNPASVHCEQNGGKLDLRQDSTGGVAGICVFSDGSECDEWAYFRDECKPGGVRAVPQPTSPSAPTRSAPTPTQVTADGWKVYRNSNLGYSLHYPPDATIVTADDPQQTLTIKGPLVGTDNWPTIFFSHPRDREDYRPPQGVDLEKWLTEHNLLRTDGKLGEARQPDGQIAGTRAIHTRFERSPQSYAYDKYYFARSQQLYLVVILHTGDKEDWKLYDHFLASIQFDS